MNVTQLVIQLVADDSKYASVLTRALRSIKDFVLTFSGIALMLDIAARGFATITESIYEAGRAVVKLGMDFENASIAFEVLTMDPKKGRELLENLQQLAVTTPFITHDLMENAKMLLGFGVAAENVIPTLARLGDLAIGDQEKLTRLALVVAEVLSEGKVTGIRMRQLSMFGIGPEEFAKTLGITVPRLRAMMKENELDANALVDTINRLTGAGGRFEQMSARAMKSVAGQWSNLVESVQILAAKFATTVFQKFNIAERLGGVANLISQNWESITSRIMQFIEAVKPVAQGLFDILVAGWQTVQQAFNLFMGDADQKMTPEKYEAIRQAVIDVGTAFVAFGQIAMQVLTMIAKFVLDVLIPAIVSLTAGSMTGINSLAVALGGTPDYARPDLKNMDLEQMNRLKAQGFNVENLQDLVNPNRDYQKALKENLSGSFESMQLLKKTGELSRLIGGGVGGFGGGVDRSFNMMLKNLEKARATPTKWKVDPIIDQKKFQDQMPKEIKIDPKAEKLAADIHKAISEGVTPLDKFNVTLDLLNKAFVGVGKGGLLSPFDLAFGQAAGFAELQKSLGKKEITLPPAAMFGSAEASEAVAKAQQAQTSVLEEVRNTLEQANKQRQQLLDRQREIAEALIQLGKNKPFIKKDM